MTSVPEVCLARELGICCANLPSLLIMQPAFLLYTHSEVLQRMKESTSKVRKLMLESIKNIKPERNCDCVKIMDQTGVKQ